MWKFADDATVSVAVLISGESSVQEAVNHISSWSHNNPFQLNPTKCKVWVVCFKKSPPSHASYVSKYLIIWYSRTKNTLLVTISMETVCMAKSGPKTNQSERTDLPQDYPAISIDLFNNLDYSSLFQARFFDCPYWPRAWNRLRLFHHNCPAHD